jgi:hypothetical protein
MSRQGAMRVYVADRFSHYERARRFMDALTIAGHTVTHDWTRTEEFGPDGHPAFGDKAESGIPKDRLAMHAEDDIRGVRTADLIVVLADEVLTGALIELGVALAFGVRVWVCAPYRWTIFWEHPLVEVLPDEQEALARLGVAYRAAA